jgi:hypothetical protein
VRRDPRAFHKFIKSRKTDIPGIPPLKTQQSLLIEDKEKSQCLNEYFSSVFTKEDMQSVPNPPISCTKVMSDFEVTNHGVLKLSSSIFIKKSTGPDDISPRILKEVCTEVSPVLTFIFNQSLSTAVNH